MLSTARTLARRPAIVRRLQPSLFGYKSSAMTGIAGSLGENFTTSRTALLTFADHMVFAAFGVRFPRSADRSVRLAFIAQHLPPPPVAPVVAYGNPALVAQEARTDAARAGVAAALPV